MTIKQIKKNGLAALAVIMTSIALASCGGGGSSAPLPGDNLGGVAPGRTDINGTVIQSTDVKASSAVGDGMPGLLVSLISTSSGQLMGTDVTDSFGKYEFKGMPSGSGYLVKVEFKSGQDLDGDGRPDEIELYFPVDLADQAVMDILQQIGVSDSDNDGQLDAVEVEFRVGQDGSIIEDSHRQHRRRSGETRIDDNSDGIVDDSFDDSDADGLPDSGSDDGSSDDNLNSLHELEVKGGIEAIDGSSITVGGTTFNLTSGTTWRIGDNRNADPAEFTVGTFVEVEGYADGNGGWNATKVKTEDDGSGSEVGDDNGGDDSNDDSGDDSGSDDSDDDNSGDDSGSDDGSDDDSGDDDSGSDDGSDDDSGDDDSGSDDGSDDDSGDDDSGSDDGSDDETEDN